MFYSKDKLTANYLRRIARAMSSSVEDLQKRKEEVEKKEKAFETKKEEAKGNINYHSEQMHILLARIKTGFIFGKDNRGDYYLKNDYTEDMQGHVIKMKKIFEELSEAYGDMEREKDNIESEERDIEDEKKSK
jgi:septal ring factor EnvC (AmiA/AmiB activator)